MLCELRVRNLAVIEDVTLQLDPGLNVLSGETGAGKSMLVDALALLLGERASVDLVRTGSERAVVEAAFEDVSDDFAVLCDEAGIDIEDGRLVIRRELNLQGRNRAWANGSPVTVSTLASLGGALVDLHGQHEAQSLLKTRAQRDILDVYGGTRETAKKVADLAGDLTNVTTQIDKILGKLDDIRKRADYLKHVVTEIMSAELKPGEDESLTIEAGRLANVERLTGLTNEFVDLLDGDSTSARSLLSAASRTLDDLSGIDTSLVKWRETLDSALAEIDEVGRNARDYAAGIEADPDRLRSIEERRDLIYRLCQKYGSTVEAVTDTGESASRELELLDTAGLDLSLLREREAALRAELQGAARQLSDLRREAGDRLSSAVNDLLPGLGMSDGSLFVNFKDLEEIGAAGAESVEFTVRLNVGHDARPLARVASGGESSRLMLALKRVLAEQDVVPTLVFDEVDQGIGGEVANQVGDALREVSARKQVLVITHLPQIAARAAHHVCVAKKPEGGVATADVRILSGEDRVKELARMLGSAEDPVVRRHASDLLKKKQPAAV
ncbi:MAG: DNA repair protein RecN [Gemmatimonadetes bacterium]|nr:DNA repair protein RecN [Gemmatimonadota bacterium]